MDEAQYAIPISWYNPIYFDTEEEAEEFKHKNNLCTPTHYSEKMGKYYSDGFNKLTDYILESIQDTMKILSIKVDLGIEYTCGRNWADCH